MSNLNVKNIDISVGNNSQNILPVPINENPSPNVPDPLNYGNSPYPIPLEPSKGRQNDDLQYCNFIAPAPRDQRLNVPYQGNKNCPTFKPQPFKKDSCYLVDSVSQGVTGIVCNTPGGTNNANFVRGNRFGVDYDFNQFDDIKKKEFTIEQPVQIPMELQNPKMVYNKSTFFPNTNFYLRQQNDYKKYPTPYNYTKEGYPTFVYPNKVLNPRKNIENFQNSENTIEILEKNKGIILSFVIIILLLLVFYLTIL